MCLKLLATIKFKWDSGLEASPEEIIHSANAFIFVEDLTKHTSIGAYSEYGPVEGGTVYFLTRT